MSLILVDSDVLIDALRGNSQARAFVKRHSDDIHISVLTITELLTGTRNRKEERAVRDLLDLFVKVDVSEAIAEQAGRIRHKYGKSHGTGVVDAVIAATAEARDISLVTLNRKHYPMLEHVKVPYKKSQKA